MTPVLQGSSLPLEQGTRYRARLLIDHNRELTPSTAIEAELEDLGFSGVGVWKYTSELPAEWPLDQRDGPLSVDQFTAFVEGVWSRPSQALPRPKEVLAIWRRESNAHSQARAVLARVAPQLSPAAVQAVQAIALHESGYGKVRNNWGSVQATGWTAVPIDCGKRGASQSELAALISCPANSVPLVDSRADGSCYVGCYKAYATPDDGARDLVRELMRRPGVVAVLDSGDAHSIAQAMHDSKYFEATVSSYAAGIARNAAIIAKALNEPLRVGGGSGGVVGLAIFAGLAAGVCWWYRKEVGHVLRIGVGSR